MVLWRCADASHIQDTKKIIVRSMASTNEIIRFVKTRRRELGLTQKELADRAGVGLRFIRDLEQGKQSVRLDKVNQVLAMFGHRASPVRVENRDEL